LRRVRVALVCQRLPPPYFHLHSPENYGFAKTSIEFGCVVILFWGLLRRFDAPHNGSGLRSFVFNPSFPPGVVPEFS